MPEFLSKSEKKRFEDFRDIDGDVVFGRVQIDPGKCQGCGLCVGCCAGGVLELFGEKKNKKSRMIAEFPFCFSCGDCVAICPEGAIQIEKFIRFNRAFRYLDRGEALYPRKF
jgi:2-oxoglutarate ferredoxin oxidoreductase subunit delta